MAPELIDGYLYGKEVDIWSTGILVNFLIIIFFLKKIIKQIMELAEGLPPYYSHKPRKVTFFNLKKKKIIFFRQPN